MYPVVLHITRQERCSRLLVLLRPVMLLPHFFWAVLYDVLVTLVLLFSGLSILLLGRHPETLWDIAEGYLRYAVKVSAYALLISDTYPPFTGGSEQPFPVRVYSTYPRRMSRAVLLFRPVLLLPHAAVLLCAAPYLFLLQQLSGLIALFAGCVPRWFWKQLSSFLLYSTRVSAFAMLLVDEYPPFNAVQPLAAEEKFDGKETGNRG